MRTLGLLAGLATFAVSRNALYAQQLQQVVFGSPSASLARGFTRLGGVRELDRTRVLVVDVADRSVHLVDFAAKRATAVGGHGQGPGEYARPAALLELPDHRTLVQDPGNGRFLELGPSGAVVGVWAPVAAAGHPVVLPPLSISGLWGSDSRGRLYFEQSPKESGGGGVLAIVRLDLQAAALFDTVATIALTDAMRTYSTAAQDKGISFRRRVWTPRWRWAVSGDGRIALVDPAQYQITWIEGVTRIAGPAVAFVPVKVTQADRDVYMESAAQPIRVAGGGGGSFAKQEGAPEFPEVMPALLSQDAIHTAPDGRLWVERAASLADTVHSYDIFDARGRLAARATAPARRRVIGFGEDAVYMVFRDADDVEYLERYRYPLRR